MAEDQEYPKQLVDEDGNVYDVVDPDQEDEEQEVDEEEEETDVYVEQTTVTGTDEDGT